MEKKGLAVLIVAILASILPFEAEAACKTRDAGWRRGQGPRITQPTRADPSRVKIDWSGIIENARCVDFYYVRMWKQGQNKDQGRKITIDKSMTSHEVEVEPCVNYKFAVEFTERDWTHTDEESSAEATFRTEAIPTFTNTDKRNFIIGYAFNQATGAHDLTKGSIKFRKNIMKYPNCIKHLEVLGKPDTSIQTGGQSQSPWAQRSNVGARSWGSNSRRVGGGSSYNPGWGGSNSGGNWNSGSTGSGGSSYNPGGGSSSGGNWNSGSSGGGSSFNPGGGSSGNWNGGSGSGGSSYNPGGGSSSGGNWNSGGSGGGGSSYNPGGGGSSGNWNSGTGSGGGSSYNPGGGGSGNWNSGGGSGSGSWSGGGGGSSFNPGGNGGWNSGGSSSHDCPPGGQSQSNGYNNNPVCYYGKPDYYPTHSHNTGSHGRPPYNSGGRYKREQRPPVGGGSSSSSGGKPGYMASLGKTTPPFLGDYVEATFAVQACSPYRLTLKIVSPRNAVLGEITDLVLPKLSDIQDFHPPPLAQMFTVQNPNSPSPTLRMASNSGIPAKCLGDFLKAVDNHMARLEDDLQFHLEQEFLAEGKARFMGQQLDQQHIMRLRDFGCQCNSAYVNVTTTTAKVISYYPNHLGAYHFDGMYNGRPFFRKPSRYASVSPLIPNNIPHEQHGGQAHGGRTGPASGQRPRTKRQVGGTSQTGSNPAPPVQGGPPVGNVHFLYWDQTTKSWMIGKSLGAQTVELKTQLNSRAKCPADPANVKSWTFSATLSWKNDPNLRVNCLP